jgi:hypothetical protein
MFHIPSISAGAPTSNSVGMLCESYYLNAPLDFGDFGDFGSN